MIKEPSLFEYTRSDQGASCVFFIQAETDKKRLGRPKKKLGRPKKKVPDVTPDIPPALSRVGIYFLFDLICFLFSGGNQKTRNQLNKKVNTNTERFEIWVFTCAR